MKALRTLLSVVAFVVPLGLLLALFKIFTPEPLDDIDGRALGATPPVPVDLLAQVNASVARGEVFRCSEAALNHYVRGVLTAREGDGFEMFADFKGVWIRLNDGSFDVVFEREVLGHKFTTSAEMLIEPTDGGFRIGAKGGKLGSLPVTSGMLNLIRKGLTNLGQVFETEKAVLSHAGGLTLENGWLRLEPR